MESSYHASDSKPGRGNSSSGPVYKDRGSLPHGVSGGSGHASMGSFRRGSSHAAGPREWDRDGRSHQRSHSRDGTKERRGSGGSSGTRSSFGTAGNAALRLRDRKNLLLMHRTGAKKKLSPADEAMRVIGMDLKYMKVRPDGVRGMGCWGPVVFFLMGLGLGLGCRMQGTRT